MTIAKPVEDLLKTLRSDRSTWATAPCGHSYRLSDSVLFYRSNFPPEALPGRDQRYDELRNAQEELKALKIRLTEGFAKKSIEVTIGKTVEKVVPGFRDFPYRPEDCRVLYEPIDYLSFVGLGRGAISSIDFVEVKTGQSALTKVQRAIRDAVIDRRVSFRRG